MITVGMGDNRTLDRVPGIDMEVPGGTIEPFVVYT
jgi:hypothetical protein